MGSGSTALWVAAPTLIRINEDIDVLETLSQLNRALNRRFSDLFSYTQITSIYALSDVLHEHPKVNRVNAVHLKGHESLRGGTRFLTHLRLNVGYAVNPTSQLVFSAFDEYFPHVRWLSLGGGALPKTRLCIIKKHMDYIHLGSLSSKMEIYVDTIEVFSTNQKEKFCHEIITTKRVETLRCEGYPYRPTFIYIRKM